MGSIGIAGPRRGDIVKITNAHWPEFNIKEVEKLIGLDTLYILNDFEANGYGILAMTKDMYTEVNKKPINPDAPKILVGTGTGLGESILAKSGPNTDYIVYPGEGGHVDFSSRTEDEFGFMMHVKKLQKLDHVSYERCCCGLSIPLLYDYLHSKVKGAASPFHKNIEKRMKELLHLITTAPSDESINGRVDEVDRLIFEAGTKKTDKICEKAVEMFAALYGAEVGNMALKILPYGGIYLCSSVTIALKNHIIKEKTFIVNIIYKN